MVDKRVTEIAAYIRSITETQKLVDLYNKWLCAVGSEVQTVCRMEDFDHIAKNLTTPYDLCRKAYIGGWNPDDAYWQIDEYGILVSYSVDGVKTLVERASESIALEALRRNDSFGNERIQSILGTKAA